MFVISTAQFTELTAILQRWSAADGLGIVDTSKRQLANPLALFRGFCVTQEVEDAIDASDLSLEDLRLEKPTGPGSHSGFEDSQYGSSDEPGDYTPPGED